MKTFILSMMLASSFGAFAEATVERMIVRQQWPWSAKVRVEYVLTGAESPVDIAVEVLDGDTAYAADAVRSATVGRTHYVTSGTYAFEIDPSKLEVSRDAIPNFRVRLTPTTATVGGGDTLYRIYDIEKGTRTDVTRADLLDGTYGAYETDFAKIGDGFATSLADVMIWTGVTNYPGTKTTKLVMRHIPAGTFTMGSTSSEKLYDRELPQHQVTLTKDFWVSVFPLTRAQRIAIGSGDECHFKTNLAGEISYIIPANDCPFATQRGSTRGSWPNADFTTAHALPSDTCILARLRKKFSGEPIFDLLTEAQWEYACRAGTTASYYSGKSWSNANLAELGFFGKDMNVTTIAEVGSYKPNAWGLYDMLGSMWESTIDRYDATAYSSEAVTNPEGLPASGGVTTCCKRGGSYRDGAQTCRCGYRSGAADITSVNWNDGMRIGLFEE